jgi:hypothetical protein
LLQGCVQADEIVEVSEQFTKWLPKQREQGSSDLLETTVSGHLKKIDAMFNHLIKSKLLDNNLFLKLIPSIPPCHSL